MALQKTARAGIMLLGISAAIFVGANAVDYFRYHNAIHRLESLSVEQFLALGDAAAKITAPFRTNNPAGFEIIKPIGEASLWPKSSDFLLYELKPTKPRYEDDRIYLYARISTSANDQEISYFTNSEGKPRSKVVWNRNPEFSLKHSPRGRILTINQWKMSESLEWIILHDRILLIADSGHVGSEPMIIDQVALSDAGLARINEALKKLPVSARGKDYRADGVMDGIALKISFNPDGKPDVSDISISNTWVEEFRAVLTAVSELGPKEHPIDFISQMTTDEHLRNYPQTVRTLAELDKLAWAEANAPWWCVWRQWWN